MIGWVRLPSCLATDEPMEVFSGIAVLWEKDLVQVGTPFDVATLHEGDHEGDIEPGEGDTHVWFL